MAKEDLITIRKSLNEIVDYCRIAETYYFNFLRQINILSGVAEKLRVLSQSLELPDEMSRLITKLTEASPMPLDPDALQDRTSEAKDFEMKVNDVLDTLDWYIEEEDKKEQL